jgi:hypothetical protein
MRQLLLLASTLLLLQACSRPCVCEADEFCDVFENDAGFGSGDDQTCRPLPDNVTTCEELLAERNSSAICTVQEDGTLVLTIGA